MSDNTVNQTPQTPQTPQKDNTEGESSKNYLGFFGITATVIYVLGLWWMTDKAVLALPTSYNELGDALAGAFSPVAFFWLVLGFFQQQKELRQNTRALNIQAKELQHSVEQYKEMVSVAKSQLNSDLTQAEQDKLYRENQTKPMVKLDKLRFEENHFGNYTFKPVLVTDGREARNVEVEFIGGFGSYTRFREESIIEKFQLPAMNISDAQLPQEVFVLISYESVIGKKYKYQYRYFDLFHGIYRNYSRTEMVTE